MLWSSGNPVKMPEHFRFESSNLPKLSWLALWFQRFDILVPENVWKIIGLKWSYLTIVFRFVALTNIYLLWKMDTYGRCFGQGINLGKLRFLGVSPDQPYRIWCGFSVSSRYVCFFVMTCSSRFGVFRCLGMYVTSPNDEHVILSSQKESFEKERIVFQTLFSVFFAVRFRGGTWSFWTAYTCRTSTKRTLYVGLRPINGVPE